MSHKPFLINGTGFVPTQTQGSKPPWFTAWFTLGTPGGLSISWLLGLPLDTPVGLPLGTLVGRPNCWVLGLTVDLGDSFSDLGTVVGWTIGWLVGLPLGTLVD